MKVYYPELIAPQRMVGRREFDFSKHVVVMAIVNRTPNSGLDPRTSIELGDAVATAERALGEGAEWIDIGGRSFRADQPPLTAQEEMERITPVISSIREITDAVISVDTHLVEVARAARTAGADVLNDTNGLRSPGIAEFVAESGMSVVISHSLAGPHSAVSRPSYEDVTAEVAAFLRERVAYALDCGVQPEKIFIDPGHDLNKNTSDSLELTRKLAEITAIGFPTVVAVSNKHFIRESLNVERGAAELKEGTIAANTMCIYQGARIVRVHDVEANVAAMRNVEALLSLEDAGA
ncbi:dihydropteroate synthase [Nonomuraea sp. NPDC049269]|uniref:dihydropteroate synthase n=1 Tax=Nonomuraea sp. NPDC049269 TaxID=3364349 RepID=UPI0037241198